MTRRTDERAELVREPERVRDSVDVSKFDESEFPGLSHEEVLALEIPPTRQLVDGIIEAATVGTIAALPETYKSLLALELAHKVARGGTVLGRCEVVPRGRSATGGRTTRRRTSSPGSRSTPAGTATRRSSRSAGI